MTTKIIINRERLDVGKPAIAVLTDEGVTFADKVTIGDVVITGTAMGHDKVSGARVWIETESKVEIHINA